MTSEVVCWARDVVFFFGDVQARSSVFLATLAALAVWQFGGFGESDKPLSHLENC